MTKGILDRVNEKSIEYKKAGPTPTKVYLGKKELKELNTVYPRKALPKVSRGPHKYGVTVGSIWTEVGVVWIVKTRHRSYVRVV